MIPQLTYMTATMTAQPKKNINGLLLLDKPTGMTSNDVLQKVKRIFQAKKAGHTGSLDPLATGMLPLCFGQATKFSQYLLCEDKTYTVKAHLGIRTTTSDSEGEIISERNVECLNNVFLEQHLDKFRGLIQQTPSMYSALKYQGKPLYTYARAGIIVPRVQRSIHIHQLTLVEYKHPHLTLFVRCSKGTYIRTLVDDLGESLGCGAHVEQLRRPTVGQYQENEMHTFETVSSANATVEDTISLLRPMEDCVRHMVRCELSRDELHKLQRGQLVERAPLVLSDGESPLCALFDDQGKFYGVAISESTQTLKAHRMMSPE